MWSRMLDPHVEHYLLDLEGEVLVDEIHRHWVTRIVPIPLHKGAVRAYQEAGVQLPPELIPAD